MYSVHVNTVHVRSGERILRAARSIHLREGAGGVSVRRVAAAVGLSPSALYRHYRDKDSLLTAVAEEGFARLEQMLAAAVRERPETGIEGVAMAYVEFAIAHPEDYELMFLVQRAGGRRFPEDFTAGRSPTFGILVDRCTAGMAAGELRRDDPIEVALTIWAELHGLVALHHVGRFGRDADRLRLQSRRAIRRIVRGIELRRD